MFMFICVDFLMYVWLCICVDFVMCGCVYVWFVCLWVFNVRLSVCLGFLMCGYVYVCFLMCGCVCVF